MVGRWITWALLVGALATPAAAAERGASFSVSVRVVAPLTLRVPPTGRPGAPVPATVSRTPSGPAVAASTFATAPRQDGSVVATLLPDGAPTAIVER